MPKKLRQVPKFANEAQERSFWESHDTADYFDLSKPIYLSATDEEVVDDGFFEEECEEPVVELGELAAVGSMTCEGSPTAIWGWACKIPSTIHNRPKPIRSSWRQAGSGFGGLSGGRT